MSNRLTFLLVRLAQVTGSCLVMVLGVGAALTRDASCRTLFAMTLGVAVASAMSTLARRASDSRAAPVARVAGRAARHPR